MNENTGIDTNTNTNTDTDDEENHRFALEQSIRDSELYCAWLEEQFAAEQAAIERGNAIWERDRAWAEAQARADKLAGYRPCPCGASTGPCDQCDWEG